MTSNSRGQTMMGFLVAALLAGVVTTLAFRMSETVGRQRYELENRVIVEGGVADAYLLILKIGRAASSCGPLVSATTLNCLVDFGKPHSGTDTPVNLTFVPGPPGSLVVTRDGAPFVTFNGISDAVFCDDASITAGTCPLGNPKINALHVDNLTGGTPLSRSETNRFLRFRIRGNANAPRTALTSEVQGAFWVRNPTGIANAFFEWGSQ